MKTKCYLINRILVILVTAVFLSFLNGHAQALNETVDEGFNPSVYVEPDGTVHLVYFKIAGNEQKLVYATRKITGDWKYRDLGLAMYCGDLAMTMDKDGDIHVIMSDYRWEETPQSRLFHGVLSKDGYWSRKIITVSWTRFFSISVKCDSKNELHLTYLEYELPARWMEMHTTSGTWSRPSAFGERGYNCLDMNIDSEDNMHVSLYNLAFGPLAYVRKPYAGGWSQPEAIDPEWGGGQLEGLVTSICTDSEMDPHVSYVGSENHDSRQHTRYAWKKDGEWHNTLVDRGQFQSGGNKIVIDNNDAVHLAYSYYHEDIYELKDVRYATNISGRWIKQTVASHVGAIEVDMGIDQNNYAHIVYGGYDENWNEYVYYNKVRISRYFDVSPDTLDFRGVLPGAEKTIALTFTNALGSDVVIDSMIIEDQRVVTDRTSLTVAAHSQEVVNVTINMTSATWKDKDLNVWFDGSFIAIPVLATNYQPELVVDPSPIDFGAVLLGTTVTKTVTLKNNGIMDLNISGVIVKYEPFPGYVIPTDFSLVSQNCGLLHHWETCLAEIKFKPLKTGSQQSYLVISSNDPSAPVMKIAITGKTAHPIISSSLYDVDFGYCAVGQSVKKDIKILNAGEVDLVISGLAISGPNSAQFSLNHTCTELEPGDSCKIEVVMTPEMLADLSATLTITSNSQYSATLNIPLHGTSLVRKLEIFPSTIDFGTVELGKKAYRLVEFRNSGAGSIILSGIMITGGDQNEFFQDIKCQTIPEGQSCTDTVWYLPSFEGMKSSSLSVGSNDPFHPVQSVSLTGGTGPALPLHVTISADPEAGIAPIYINFSSLITGGQGPYWYRWDIEDIGSYTEQESVRVQFPNPGIYTAILKVTDINHQTDADTIMVAVSSVTAPVVLAKAEPVAGDIPLPVSFDAIVSGGEPPLSFFWNFRDGGTSYILNPDHLYSNTGTYWARITVTDANGDLARDSVLITARWNTSFSGQIWDNDGLYPVNESVVRFIQRVNIMNVWTDIPEGTNEYLFRNLEPGEYTVLAIPDTGEYPQYLPTYLGRKLTLNEAKWVNMTGYVTGQDVRLIKKPFGSNGQGSLYGNIGIVSSPKGTYGSFKGISEAQDDNLSGIYIYLLDAGSGELIAYDITDEFGDFSIDGLENGTYVIIVDYKGLPMDPANTVLVISDEMKSAELNVVVHNDRISVINLTTGMEENLPVGVKVYPVPAGERIMLDVPEGFFRGETVRMSIISLSGSTIRERSMADLPGHPFEVDLSGLPDGVYVLRLSDSRDVINIKVVRAGRR